MAISIDYSTYPYVINIPKADMIQTQVSPIEIRQLNIGDFHAVLRDLEDDEAGICFPRTHTYVAPLAVGGVSLAYVISITDDYTVTFENGAYAVDLVGGNSNIADRVNINNVSVRSANSAGLPDLAAIQATSFQGAVAVKAGSPYSGTTYPVGTRGYPVNNITDARLIADKYFLDTILVIGNFTFDTGDDISGFNIMGQNAAVSSFTINTGAVTNNARITDAVVTGTLDGGTLIERCVISNLDYINGFIHQCMINPGTIRLGGSTSAHFLHCYSGVPGISTPIIDMNGAGAEDTPLAIRGYNGGIKLIEKTGSGAVSIDLSSGQVVIDSTCVAGTIVVRGTGKVVDSLGNGLHSGTINGGLTLINETVMGAHIHDIHQDMGLDVAYPVSISDDGTTTTKIVGDITKLITDTSITRT